MVKYAINVRNQHNAIHSLFEVESKKEVKILNYYLGIINKLENWCYSIEDLKNILLQSYRFLHMSKKSFINPNFNWNLEEDIQHFIELVWHKLYNDKRVTFKSYEINYRDIDENKSEYIYDSNEKPIIIYNYPSYTISI